MELEFWRSIKEQRRRERLELYVRSFPKVSMPSLAHARPPSCAAAPRGRQRHPHHGGSRQDAGSEKRPARRSEPRRSAKPRRACRVEKTVKLASAASAGEKKSLLVLGILGVLLLSGAAAYFL